MSLGDDGRPEQLREVGACGVMCGSDDIEASIGVVKDAGEARNMGQRYCITSRIAREALKPDRKFVVANSHGLTTSGSELCVGLFVP